MKPRHQNRRLTTFILCAIVVVSGVYLILSALKDNTQFFHNPSGIVADGFVQQSEKIRVGGFVAPGSVQRGEALFTQFTVRDFENPNALPDRLKVEHVGVLPDLFREGEGVVLTGSLNAQGVFVASEVLAKHDNEYRPKLPEAGF